MAACRATGDKRFFEQAFGWARAKDFAVGYEHSGSNRLFPADTWCELANRGVLDRTIYEPVVRKAWAGLVANVADDGKVLFGQNVGDQPGPVKREDSHEYVTGTFLLVASEMYKLEGGRPADTKEAKTR